MHPISSGPEPLPPTRADADLARRVARRLTAELPAPDKRIVVEAQNRVIILEGVVSTARSRATAHRLAWLTAGVADVSNRLTVTGAEAGP